MNTNTNEIFVLTGADGKPVQEYAELILTFSEAIQSVDIAGFELIGETKNSSGQTLSNRTFTSNTELDS